MATTAGLQRMSAGEWHRGPQRQPGTARAPDLPLGCLHPSSQCIGGFLMLNHQKNLNASPETLRLSSPLAAASPHACASRSHQTPNTSRGSPGCPIPPHLPLSSRRADRPGLHVEDHCPKAPTHRRAVQGIREPLRLKKTSKIITSNHHPNPTTPAKPRPKVPHPQVF